MSIRVLIVQPSLHDYRVDLFNGLADQPDLDVTVVHPGRAFTHARSVRFAEHRSDPRSLAGFHYDPGLQKAARAQDLLVLPFDLRWLLPTLPFLRGRTVLLWGHGYGRSRLARPVRTALARSATSILLYNAAEAGPFLQAGVHPDRVHIAGNTIAVPNHGVAEHSRTRFLFVGRLTSRKGLDELLSAFYLIKDDIPGAFGISIVGDGPSQPQLREQIKHLGLGLRVTLYPSTHDPDQLRLHFARALAYVSPRAVGLGVLHSFAYGIPVVTNYNAHHGPEYWNLDDSNSIRYTGGPSELSRQLVNLAHRPDLSRSLGANGYDLYRSHFLIEHMIQRFSRAIRLTVALD